MRRIAVLTSGGDAPGMNACIRAVVRTGLHHDLQVVGIRRGYAGMIDGDFWEMDAHSVSNIIQLGGTILQSARSEEFRTAEGRKMAYQQLKKRGIEGVVAIGGDGTFTGANIFMKEYSDIAFVGIPGTIDNDLYGTDFTIGYDTAINTAMNAIDNIKDTANAHNRLFFIEVMGRDAGFIALRSGIATGAEAVLIPESKTNIDRLIDTLEYNFNRKKTSSIVVVAEGDDAGGAFTIAEKVKQKFNHYDIRVTILGHIQRGGRPTCMERVLASRLGMEAVRALLQDMKGVMVGEQCRKIVYTPFENAIKHHQEINPILLEMVEILS
ncbi:MAG: 6-phosphofructokinase [Saprospiraceae bacterium]|nr:6-phosphofructokinase [Saprospiraceae bacterium]MCB0625143.1 6-phosphofructokinase [Saprospiraceae bacterium]MCB0678322.1 6-phosphofructokinase [Saprospiraceae bacterium]MCB0683048.1 6-phosphofructokinase [Saprospiraceae bacterium]